MNKIPMSVVFESLALLIVCCGTGCVSVPPTDDIPVIKGFDAARYMGLWHEIARLPKWYERDMIHVSAEYALDGDVLRIKNRGWRDNEMKVSTAVGYFAGPSDEGAFRISFFRPFYGDYRIIWLSPEYDLALVTGDDRSSLWILARTAEIPSGKLDLLVEQAARLGFDVSRLEYPQQRLPLNGRRPGRDRSPPIFSTEIWYNSRRCAFFKALAQDGALDPAVDYAGDMEAVVPFRKLLGL